MRTRDTSSGMPGQQQVVLLHQPVDPLGIDGIEAGGSPLALEERGDPPVPIAWPGVHQAPDFGCEFPISGAALGTTLAAFASCSLNQIGSGDSEGLCDPLQGVSSGNCDCDSKVGSYKIPSLFRISSSMVLRPSSRSSSRTRSSSVSGVLRSPFG